MAGAIAGTALINYAPSFTDKLETVTLTINNLCNLKCPHCYLQYKQEYSNYITNEIISRLVRSNYKHLVIVGKEPLVDAKSIEIIRNILSSVNKNVTVGLITNGHGLKQLDKSTINRFAYVDVSIDGGPKTYSSYRKGDFINIITTLNEFKIKGFSSFNALHVLNDITVNYINDMISVGDYFDFSKIMFSPYLETLNDGKNTVNRLSIEAILRSLAASQSFLKSENAFLLLDIYHLLGDNRTDWELLKLLIKNLNLSKKVALIEKDPIEHGFIRLTYDGVILSPYESLNPRTYKLNHLNILDIDLNSAFERLSENHTKVSSYAN